MKLMTFFAGNQELVTFSLDDFQQKGEKFTPSTPFLQTLIDLMDREKEKDDSREILHKWQKCFFFFFLKKCNLEINSIKTP